MTVALLGAPPVARSALISSLDDITTPDTETVVIVAMERDGVRVRSHGLNVRARSALTQALIELGGPPTCIVGGLGAKKGCGALLTVEEAYYYGTACEACTQADHAAFEKAVRLGLDG
jgi:hypothetical protein